MISMILLTFLFSKAWWVKWLKLMPSIGEDGSEPHNLRVFSASGLPIPINSLRHPVCDYTGILGPSSHVCGMCEDEKVADIMVVAGMVFFHKNRDCVSCDITLP